MRSRALHWLSVGLVVALAGFMFQAYGWIGLTATGVGGFIVMLAQWEEGRQFEREHTTLISAGLWWGVVAYATWMAWQLKDAVV